MLATCATCEARVPVESAIAVDTPAGTRVQVCSARCADVARGGAAPVGPLPSLPRRLVVGVDGSGPSLRAVQWAVTLARASGGTLHLVHAIEPLGLRGLGDALPPGRVAEVVREVEAALRADAEAQLRAARAVCEAAAVAFDETICFAAPVDAIAEAAANADLVVLGSRGRGAVAGALFGSVSQRVPALVHLPVLVVH